VGLLIVLFRFNRGVSPEAPFQPAQEELVEGSAPRF